MRIAVNGVELFFDVYSSGLGARGNELVDKPVIVALHGGPGIDHSQFVPWLTPIADAAQLILVDHRGNGRSSRPPVETRTLANMADDLEALRKALGLAVPPRAEIMRDVTVRWQLLTRSIYSQQKDAPGHHSPQTPLDLVSKSGFTSVGSSLTTASPWS